MKLMFASDIHGSALWCERLLEAYRREGAQRLCLLGDILYHGPRNDLPQEYAPKRVAEMLNNVKSELFCVRGNCDTEVDQMVLDFSIMSDSAMIIADGRTLFLSHGHHHSPEALPPLKQGDVLINGHTHIMDSRVVDGVLCLNDGSVSLPKNGNPHTYMVYENGTFLIREMGGELLLTKSW